jgi:hypothetical protein
MLCLFIGKWPATHDSEFGLFDSSSAIRDKLGVVRASLERCRWGDPISFTVDARQLFDLIVAHWFSLMSLSHV